jgi:hypothetical protein
MYISDFFFSLPKKLSLQEIMFNRSKEDVVGPIHVYAFSSDTPVTEVLASGLSVPVLVLTLMEMC